ncbi:hypothetical protein QR680_007764 [Steinernema hermaphroditum]|uniref:Uncharacterized protein n=1 Tax=Steinernema hermaphroditum TaxID=289476 RepID=A0AA39IE67_9BILA|nr:hypothetical protein QR680_007764 [Steinernema hermaphroditum]
MFARLVLVCLSAFPKPLSFNVVQAAAVAQIRMFASGRDSKSAMESMLRRGKAMASEASERLKEALQKNAMTERKTVESVKGLAAKKVRDRAEVIKLTYKKRARQKAADKIHNAGRKI